MIGVLIKVATALREAEIPYAIGGSFASGAWSSPRITLDIDIAVRMRQGDAERLAKILGDDFYIESDGALAAILSRDEYRMFQGMYIPEVTKIDFFVVGDDEYSRSELERAVPVQVAEGMEVRHTAPENIIIQKLRWYELGNRVSDRQWNDIVKVIEVQRGRLDWEYMRRWAQHFGLVELLEEADAEALD
ncbi:MAG: hypothetical protein WAO58_07280 [Fimbriimonadaceae bacterium]